MHNYVCATSAGWRGSCRLSSTGHGFDLEETKATLVAELAGIVDAGGAEDPIPVAVAAGRTYGKTEVVGRVWGRC